MTTRKLTFTTLLFILTLGCTDRRAKDNPTGREKAVSDFNLQTDLFNFSSRMTDLDTLTIYADLSACTSWQKETNTVTKQNGQIFVNGSAVSDNLDNQDEKLEQVKYDYLPTDTLNFEDLFRYMNDKGAKDRKINSVIFTITYKQQTVKYFSKNLIDRLLSIDYYIKVKSRLYPEKEKYKPRIIPHYADTIKEKGSKKTAANNIFAPGGVDV